MSTAVIVQVATYLVPVQTKYGWNEIRRQRGAADFDPLVAPRILRVPVLSKKHQLETMYCSLELHLHSTWIVQKVGPLHAQALWVLNFQRGSPLISDPAPRLVPVLVITLSFQQPNVSKVRKHHRLFASLGLLHTVVK